MNTPLCQVLERNVLEVFGQQDSGRGKSVIAELYTAELYTEDSTFFEADEKIIGRDALNAKVGHILEEAPGFVFRLAGQPEVNHDHGRLRWHFGPNAAAPLSQGWMLRSSSKGACAPCMPFLTRLLAISGIRKPCRSDRINARTCTRRNRCNHDFHT